MDGNSVVTVSACVRLTFHTSLEQASSRPSPVASSTAQQQTVGSAAQVEVRAGWIGRVENYSVTNYVYN